MENDFDQEEPIVNGEVLKSAREAKGFSVGQMAQAVTLSRDQIFHIEEGGLEPFYTYAHKLLAVRKYASGLDIPYENVVTHIPTEMNTTSSNVNTKSKFETESPIVKGTNYGETTFSNSKKNLLIFFFIASIILFLGLYAKFEYDKKIKSQLFENENSEKIDDSNKKNSAKINQKIPNNLDLKEDNILIDPQD